MKEAPL